MTDLQIIELYWNRSEDAITQTNQKYGAYCFTVANTILSDAQDAEECVSDTWLKAWLAIPPQRPDKLKLFLAKITRNLSVDRLKARLAQKRGGGEAELVLEELDQCIPTSMDTEQAYSMKELGRFINQFVRALPEREGNLFIRRYFYGEAVETIALRYHIKPHNAAVILSRVRLKLKRHLEQEGFCI